MPWKRNWASKSCSLSRILVSLGVKGKEVADHPFENELLEASKIEQAELQSLFDGGEEWTGGIGAFQLEQATQGADTAAAPPLLESGGVAFEAGMMASQELLFQHGTAARSDRGGMVLGHGVARIALFGEPRMARNLRATPVDQDVSRILVDGDRSPDEAFRDRVAIGVNGDVTVKIDNALEDLVDRRKSTGATAADKASRSDRPLQGTCRARVWVFDWRYLGTTPAPGGSDPRSC